MRIRKGTFWDVSAGLLNTVKSLIQVRMSIRLITVQGDGGGPLVEATRARIVCSSNLLVRVVILKC